MDILGVFYKATDQKFVVLCRTRALDIWVKFKIQNNVLSIFRCVPSRVVVPISKKEDETQTTKHKHANAFAIGGLIYILANV